MTEVIARVAPLREQLIKQVRELLRIEDGEVPEPDTFNRSDYRMGITLACYDVDDDPDDEGIEVRDLLTDLLHYCEARNLDIDELLQRARWMASEEHLDWAEHDVNPEPPSRESPLRAVSGEF